MPVPASAAPPPRSRAASRPSGSAPPSRCRLPAFLLLALRPVLLPSSRYSPALVLSAFFWYRGSHEPVDPASATSSSSTRPSLRDWRLVAWAALVGSRTTTIRGASLSVRTARRPIWLRRAAYVSTLDGSRSVYEQLVRPSYQGGLFNRSRSVNQYLTHWIYPYRGKFPSPDGSRPPEYRWRRPGLPHSGPVCRQRHHCSGGLAPGGRLRRPRPLALVRPPHACEDRLGPRVGGTSRACSRAARARSFRSGRRLAGCAFQCGRFRFRPGRASDDAQRRLQAPPRRPCLVPPQPLGNAPVGSRRMPAPSRFSRSRQGA